jgi:hypothetical protein
MAPAHGAGARQLGAQPPAAHRALEDLRQPSPQPAGAALVALLVAGWTILPGSPAIWTAIGLVAMAFPSPISS